MQYKSCQWVNRGIEFRTNELRLCCYGYLQGRETEYQTTIKEYDDSFALIFKINSFHAVRHTGQYFIGDRT